MEKKTLRMISPLKIVNKKAFTLIEVIIVVVILGIIFTMVLPNFNRDFGEKNRFGDIKKYLYSKVPNIKNKIFTCDKGLKCYIFNPQASEEDEQLEEVNIPKEIIEELPIVIQNTENRSIQYGKKGFFIVFFKDGTTNSSIIKYKGKIYLMEREKDELKEFKDVDEALEYIKKKREIKPKIDKGI